MSARPDGPPPDHVAEQSQLPDDPGPPRRHRLELLPLDAENWITCGNALRLDWLAICPPTDTGVRLVGDDLFVTNTAILKKGIAEGLGNSILIKVNQNGSVSGTLAVMAL